jgi:hypothetical protein
MRALTTVLGVIVLALVGSWAWARFGPHDPIGVTRTLAGAPGAAGDAAAPAAQRVIRVEVLNGTREGGVGNRVASYLREGGFHVVGVGNADRSDYFATLVVARSEDPSAARAVARYLGSPPVVLQARGGDAADVSLVIGSDRSHVRIEP